LIRVIQASSGRLLDGFPSSTLLAVAPSGTRRWAYQRADGAWLPVSDDIAHDMRDDGETVEVVYLVTN